MWTANLCNQTSLIGTCHTHHNGPSLHYSFFTQGMTHVWWLMILIDDSKALSSITYHHHTHIHIYIRTYPVIRCYQYISSWSAAASPHPHPPGCCQWLPCSSPCALRPAMAGIRLFFHCFCILNLRETGGTSWIVEVLLTIIDMTIIILSPNTKRLFLSGPGCLV